MANSSKYDLSQLASPWGRLVGFVIDSGIGIMVTLLLLLRMAEARTVGASLTGGLELLIVMVIWLPLLWPILLSYLTAHFGGTIGQLLTGIEVVHPDGKRLSFKEALFRMYAGNMVANILVGLGYLWVFRDSNRQGWHDMVSDAVVVSKNRSLVIVGVVIVLGFLVGIGVVTGMVIDGFKRNWSVYEDFGKIIQEEYKDYEESVPEEELEV